MGCVRTLLPRIVKEVEYCSEVRKFTKKRNAAFAKHMSWLWTGRSHCRLAQHNVYKKILWIYYRLYINYIATAKIKNSFHGAGKKLMIDNTRVHRPFAYLLRSMSKPVLSCLGECHRTFLKDTVRSELQ